MNEWLNDQDHARDVLGKSYDINSWDTARARNRGWKLLDQEIEHERIFQAAMNTPNQVDIFAALEQLATPVHAELLRIKKRHAPRPRQMPQTRLDLGGHSA